MFFYLHTSSVTACRDLQLHHTDSRGYDSSVDDPAQREIKRRLWWLVTATDWMSGFNGGSLDGTYTIQQRQFRVAMPRNLNDAELGIDSDDIADPSHVATQTSCFLQVVRLAEISHAVIDVHNSEDGLTIDEASNERVLALDELFANTPASFPPPLILSSSIPVDQVASPRSEKRDVLHHDDHENCPSFPVYRLGIVVNHLFWACSKC